MHLTNVKIVDVVSGRLYPQNEILITDGKITSLKPKKRQTKNHEVIDGGGRYVIPGLFEMHAHIGPSNRNYLDTFLKYGITNVRVMAGNEGLLAWRDSINKELMVGPDLFVASPLYDGNPPLWGDNHSGPVLENKSDVERLVREHQQKGYDEIKVYNRLAPDVYLEILRVADAAGMRVSGHIPYTLPSENFGDPRHRSIEHLDGLIQFALSTTPHLEHGKEEGQRLSLYPHYEKSNLAPLAHRLKQNKVWLCPTLSLYGNFNNALVREQLDKVKHLEPASGLLGWWSSLPKQVGLNFKVKYDFNKQVLQDHFMDHADYILAGTDSPNPYNLPGLALHQELHYLADAGFSDATVLKIATYNAARYLGVLDEYGTVSVGKHANLLLLDENPLLDIRNTTKIHQVILRGRVQDRK
ncbi:amidohydrolase family protein [Pontibacter sp. JH31]|uniref:Amidohydrolase family protein n=1 Tax=Pontibacter aquaedesilientis TaxID=2766980 RepID=A0ABR7XNP1_9BACT|nr:amidohydrolase family protein [Pontibacter aquaedesilientis]MBD1399026.1 amidohydrolase family protein [Pontibacter aquaedesilientis]